MTTPSRYWAWSLSACAIILLFATVHRVSGLDDRPMHGDEANQAIKTGILLEEGTYTYDPHDHHGPTLYYAAALSAIARGQWTIADTDELTFRIVPVVFGLLTILSMWLWVGGLGRWGAVVAGALLAMSPAFTYYNRYFIQETMLVFFTLMLIIALWGYINTRKVGWAIVAGASAGLMHATKETCVLAFAAMGGAAFMMCIARREAALKWFRDNPRSLMIHTGVAIAIGACISIVLFSGFFTNLRGPLDSILTYGNYLKRAEGAGMHDKPWYYYFQVLGYYDRGLGRAWSEWPVLLLGFCGIVLAWLPSKTSTANQTFVRFIAIFTVLLTIAYSMIPYKTPWSMLTFYVGILLLGAYACGRFYDWFSVPRHGDTRQWMTAMAVAFAAPWILGYPIWNQLQNAIHKFEADPRNPYVYAHTSSSFTRLSDQIHDLKAIEENRADFTVYVIEPTGDYWPIPWYTRDIERVGYFAEPPESADADMIIVSPSVSRAVYDRVNETHTGPMTHGLRPGVLLHTYVKRDIWDRYIQSR